MLGTVQASPTIDLGSPRFVSRPSLHSAANSVDAAIVPSAIARAAVAFEYASLRYHGHCPLGMYITPSPENLLVWDAVLFIHRGYYMDSILKFRLTFPPDYPERPPVVQFMTDIFHPPRIATRRNIQPRKQVSSVEVSGLPRAPQMSVGGLMSINRPKENHVYDVLHLIKASFKKHALDQLKETDCFNKEAFRYHDSTSSFAALATQSSLLSQTASALFDSDHPSMTSKGPAHNLPFRELKPEQSRALRAKLGLQEWDDEDPV
ncbi:hypothetical protein EW146_g1469 [Bondarzewia mesenterica]|uniref:UBC core domain-containing protein n=1 Tax=Bondarzewia mesenterica TaxID=1095465 RepID=A0A4V3XG31_9AGAM|nr:hypothetical protein EW146_g1469 [Bondarzewia mesenterica]